MVRCAVGVYVCCSERKRKTNKRFKFKSKLNCYGCRSISPFYNRRSFRLWKFLQNILKNFLFFVSDLMVERWTQDLRFPIGFHPRLEKIVLFRKFGQNRRRKYGCIFLNRNRMVKCMRSGMSPKNFSSDSHSHTLNVHTYIGWHTFLNRKLH